MKLNQELLNRIKDAYALELISAPWYQLYEHNTKWAMDTIYNEVCRRYSEQIIKCDVCEGSGEREIYHEICGHSPIVCEFCEGKGYL